MSRCLILIVAPLLLAAQPPKPAPDTKTVAGNWEGTLKVGAVELRLAFKLKPAGEGTLTGTMDSIDQGAKDIPIETATFADGKLTLDFPKLKASFEGTLSEDGKVVAGKWKQSGLSLPLELKRVEKVSELRRPQTPKPPFPYRAEDVTFPSKSEGVTLAGTLTVPEGKGPFPAAILLSGSGPQDRDETLFGHKPFAVLADFLTRKGIAVLRFDDRGVGKSTGDHASATTPDFADDAEGAVEFLKARKEADPKRIGLIGHSEGGLTAPLVAARRDDIAFLVLLAAPGLPGEEILYQQGEAIVRASGGDAEAVKAQRAIQKRLFDVAREGGNPDELKKRLREEIERAIRELPEGKRDDLGEGAIEMMKRSADRVAAPWFRFFLTHDPRPTLRKVRCPVLALTGEHDLQVVPGKNLPEVEKALKEGGNRDVTVAEVPGVNHLFQTSESGLPSAYGKIEETFAPKVMERIADWILARK